jgi:hypothetical protein
MHRNRSWITWIGVAVFGLAFAMPAAAEHDERERALTRETGKWVYRSPFADHPAGKWVYVKGREPVRRHTVHHNAVRPWRARYRQAAVRHPRVVTHRNAYYCEPCEHRFKSRARFDRHLHRHHHVALWRLPFAIVYTTLGAIFYG